MSDCKGYATPIASDTKLSRRDNSPFSDPSLYRIVVGSLQYIIVTRLEIAYVVNQDTRVIGYTNSNWESDPDDRMSTNSYCVFYGANLVAWSSKKQHVVSRSRTEAEYREITTLIPETTWLKNILNELRTPLQSLPLLYCDNLGAVQLAANPIFHSKSKHFAMNLSFVRDHVVKGGIISKHVPKKCSNGRHLYKDRVLQIVQ
ncbi:uncharacterized protein LOC107646608 [Arachis ipaensis]|uniref:uncharacterized protein LOC107646608 n=1 Tax=Arachis ipaensis TaxID=130454 RepID=UPI0007AFD80F|nr:uncharacterized protein LOC107646608 [Arachis ipaensis]